MEDLDALLADLQSTSTHVTSYQGKQAHSHQSYSQQHHQHCNWEPPVSNHHNHQVHHQQQQHQQHQQQQQPINISGFSNHHNHQIPSRQQHQQLQQQPTNISSFPYHQTNNRSFDSDGNGSIYHLQQKIEQCPTSRTYFDLEYRDEDDQDPVDYSSRSELYRSQDFASSAVTSPRQENYPSVLFSSRSSTPPPLPPPPSSDLLDCVGYNRDTEQPIYERQIFRMRESTPSSSSGSSDRGVQQQRPPQKGERGERMSALSSNLSELDQLLQDLNSAQFMAELDHKSSNNIITFLNYLEDQSDGKKVNEVTVNDSAGKQPPSVAPKPGSKSVQRGPVDNLLDQLEGVEPQPGRFPVGSHYQELSTVSTNHSQHHLGYPDSTYHITSSSSSSYHHQQNTSSATKELDELMMSLSEFKILNQDDHSDEPAYAKPIKSQSVSSSSPTSPRRTGPGYNQIHEHRQQYQPQQRENGLEMMLGDLQSDMNRQGVNIKQKGVCAACQKPIAGQVIAALGRTWHVEHFVCAHCEEPLGTRNFYERDSKAYCETDYHHLFAPRCAYCNGPIIDKCITALEKMWHPEHFFCAQCGRPFGDEDFHEKNGKAYCRDDYFQMFAPKCGGCAQPIVENYISALNRQWHPQCFVCWECRSTFGAGSFFDYEGLPYCETHYHARKGSLCASCERPITGRCITAMFKKFHPEHFVCAFCLKQLNKGTFKEQNDKPYCHPCFVKLFG